jgi:hypothetical protein
VSELIPVFAGPSLPPEARRANGFDWRSPASAGDLLAMIERPPDRLCLIDGFFGSRPAPWHKELLELMARGTTVFGAASMGALRAAELSDLGMIGIGVVFRAYRDRLITGDDEVALIHADERLHWVPLTVPMVEVRATLAAACRAGLLTGRTARAMRTVLHDIYFEVRDWPLMEEACVAEGLMDRDSFHRFRTLHVQLKRDDALACLVAAREKRICRPVTPPPPRTCFTRALSAEIEESASRAQAPS